MKTYTKHPISGDAAEVKRLVLTDNNATAKEILSLWSGGECLFAKEANVTKSGNVMKDIDGNDVTAWTLQGERPMCSYPWEAEIVGKEGYQLLPWSAVVTMKGVNITNSCYNPSTCKINIPMVKGDISISVEAVAMDANYKPVVYIGVDEASANNIINLGYSPNSNTKIELDVKLKEVQGVLYGTLNSSSVSASNPNFYAFIRSTQSAGRFAFGTKESGSSSPYRLGCGERFVFSCDRGEFNYKNANGTAASTTLSTGAWTMSTGLRLFGRYNSSTYTGAGDVYRVKIYEWDSETQAHTLLHDFVPVKRLSDGKGGLYDVVLGISNPFKTATANYNYPE